MQAQRIAGAGSLTSPREWNNNYCKMTRIELIIQLLKVAIGLAFGAYFVWWSLQVLDRLTPEYDAATACGRPCIMKAVAAPSVPVEVDARLRAA